MTMGTQSTAYVVEESAMGARNEKESSGETYEVVEDLVTDNARHLEALLACDRVDNHVAVDANEVLGVKNTVLILKRAIMSAVFAPPHKQESFVLQRHVVCTRNRRVAQGSGLSGSGAAALTGAGTQENLTYLASSIDNLRRKVLVLPLDHLAEGILDGRVVAVNEVTVDELHRHTRLACADSRQSRPRWHGGGRACCSSQLRLLTDSSTADNGHLSLLGWSGHFAGEYCYSDACGLESTERFARVASNLQCRTVNSYNCRDADAQARCFVDLGAK